MTRTRPNEILKKFIGIFSLWPHRALECKDLYFAMIYDINCYLRKLLNKTKNVFKVFFMTRIRQQGLWET